MSDEVKKITSEEIINAMKTGKTGQDCFDTALYGMIRLDMYYENKITQMIDNCIQKIREIKIKMQELKEAREQFDKIVFENAMGKSLCSQCPKQAEFVCCMKKQYCSVECQQKDQTHLPVCVRINEDL